mmetsp:Transcript_124815/g.249248  ORF Transcript_124815/g.249248 Transcript_124815/m.249248 type:complete len:272 (+) Transcript_124815:28-843(+)
MKRLALQISSVAASAQFHMQTHRDRISLLKENQRPHLHGLAHGCSLRSAGMIESGVQRKRRRYFICFLYSFASKALAPRVPVLDEDHFFSLHFWEVKPVMLIRGRREVVFLLVVVLRGFERHNVIQSGTPAVAKRHRGALHGLRADVAPHVDDHPTLIAHDVLVCLGWLDQGLEAKQWPRIRPGLWGFCELPDQALCTERGVVDVHASSWPLNREPSLLSHLCCFDGLMRTHRVVECKYFRCTSDLLNKLLACGIVLLTNVSLAVKVDDLR